MLDPDNTTQSDLRGGLPPWSVGFKPPARRPVRESFRCDVLVVGGGITGSLAAEHLTRRGHRVCLIDRERPGFGSTAASTAMLQWEIDASLAELTGWYGFDRAAHIYRLSLDAVTGLKQLVSDLRAHCAFRDRSSLYITGGTTGADEIRNELALRERAGLPGVFLDYLPLKREFGLDREAALFSPGSADADPLQLSHALLASAISQGAQVFEAEAVGYLNAPGSVTVALDSGYEIEAGHVVLATGYVMPDFVKTDLHKVSSSWAIATPPQEPKNLWRQGVLIWEASEAYNYARTTGDDRIVLGGEDDDRIVEPDDRDSKTPEKMMVLLQKLSKLWPAAEARADFAWSGAFGETADGLPLIGQVPGHPRIVAAYGYGGNGITFSYLASRLIGRTIAGDRED